MAAEVEEELRQMEQAEFERLAAEEKEFETAGLADVESQQVGQSFDAWDAQYDGLVTVRYSLKGRSGRDLDVPGYLCEGGAMVEVAIEVDPSGRVVQAVLKGGSRGLLVRRLAERQASPLFGGCGGAQAPTRRHDVRLCGAVNLAVVRLGRCNPGGRRIWVTASLRAWSLSRSSTCPLGRLQRGEG